MGMHTIGINEITHMRQLLILIDRIGMVFTILILYSQSERDDLTVRIELAYDVYRHLSFICAAHLSCPSSAAPNTLYADYRTYVRICKDQNDPF